MTTEENSQGSSQNVPAVHGGARITAIIATVITFVVMAGTVLIVLPSGTPLKKEVQAIASPIFSQNWRVFAPNILKVDRTLELRAQWRDDNGELVRSDWVSVTDIETQTVRGNVAPSRIQKNSWNASGTFLQRYSALEQDQKTRVRDTFIQSSGDSFEPIPVEELIEELGEGDSNVVRYLRMDYMFMRYLTLYATAGFNEKIERVQWRVVRERPNDFQHRFNDEQLTDPTITTFGWRHSNVNVEQGVVDEYRALIERSGSTSIFTKAAEHVE